jgi:hypothetical protein
LFRAARHLAAAEQNCPGPRVVPPEDVLNELPRIDTHQPGIGDVVLGGQADTPLLGVPHHARPHEAERAGNLGLGQASILAQRGQVGPCSRRIRALNSPCDIRTLATDMVDSYDGEVAFADSPHARL